MYQRAKFFLCILLNTPLDDHGSEFGMVVGLGMLLYRPHKSRYYDYTWEYSKHPSIFVCRLGW